MASLYGGGIYATGYTLLALISNNVLNGNNALVSGGELYASNSVDNLTISNIFIQSLTSINSFYFQSINFTGNGIAITSMIA